VRERLCGGLGFLGIALDPARNAAHADVVSGPAGRATVRVIGTDEELMIARAWSSRSTAVRSTSSGAKAQTRGRR
jgi:acetate kinase